MNVGFRYLFFGSLCLFVCQASGMMQRPNVIVIYADDQGSVDANCYGSTDLVTPAIDSLADQGVRFTQFYSPAPVCSASRAGMLTGRYPWLAGYEGNAGGPPREDIQNLEDLDGKPGVFAKQTTMAEMFKSAGYDTGHVGKWHLGVTPGSKPLDQGFDYSFGHMGGCVDNFTHFFYWNGPNRHDLWENNKRIRLPGKYFPDLMVDKATRFIKQQRDDPFFLYFAFNLPHYPYQGDQHWIDHYKDLPYPRNLYAAFLSTLDARLEKLLKVLEDEGIRDNTIVIYQSDNGHSTEVRAHGGGGSSGPYRGQKFSLFEGGIRLPAVISWPGHLPQGVVRNQMAHGCDWLPTVAELCQVNLPKAPINGKSLMPIIRSANAPSPHETLHWQMGKNRWAVRNGNWKLTSENGLFLANILDDPGEKINLSQKNPEIVNKLKTMREAIK
ncbi:sulfatase-like hydrolase/transferase [Mariniblastus sp.]|nr:sulfatase-like hydrolase/transferase [Mariniblastus sp.]